MDDVEKWRGMARGGGTVGTANVEHTRRVAAATPLPTVEDEQIRCVRVVNGPLRGAMYLLNHRVVIGRDGVCDIHLANSEVSRQHAELREDDAGRHVLVDLGSTNGTWCQAAPVSTRPLEPGDIFSIGGMKFMYDDASPDEREELPVVPGLQLRQLDMHQLKPASAVDASDLPRPSGGAVVQPSAQVLPLRQPEASNDAGEDFTYQARILQDIVRYRSLRIRKIRGEALGAKERVELTVLGRRLVNAGPAQDERRQAVRFTVSLSGMILPMSDTGLPVMVENIGVDGARLSAEHHGLQANTQMWLAVGAGTTAEPGGAGFVFAARLAWATGDRLGVTFAGAPGWTSRPGNVGGRKTANDLSSIVARLRD